MQGGHNCSPLGSSVTTTARSEMDKCTKMAPVLTEGSHPQQKMVDGAPFPALIVLEGGSFGSGSGAAATAAEAVLRQKEWVEGLIRRSGAVLLRGLPFKNAQDFCTFLEVLGFQDFGYKNGSATRKSVCGPVLTANDTPLELEIGFHNEMAYLSAQPDLVLLFCEVPSPQGGATPIVRGSVVYKRTAEEFPEFIAKMEKEGLIYFHILSDHGQDSWQTAFQTDDRLEAEERARKVGRTLEWLADGKVKSFLGPCLGIKRDTLRDQMVWFNNIGTTSPRVSNIKNAAFGDGSSLPPEAVERSLEIMKEEQVVIPWNTGDIMIIDNTAALHSRQSGKPPRSVLVALCKT